MKRILHINFDVYSDPKVDHKVGGVPCAIQNIIKYLSRENKHKILTFDSSINKPEINDGNYIFPNINKSYFSNFIRSPLKVYNSFKNIDTFVFHHLPPPKILILLRFLFPFKNITCFVYTRQVVKFKLHLLMIDLFMVTDPILRDSLIKIKYPKNKIKEVGVLPDVDQYDIQTNNIPFDFLKNNSKIWYSAGPRVEMGYEVFIGEILKDVEEKHNFRITLLGNVEVKINQSIKQKDNVEIGNMYNPVSEAMADVDIMAYLIVDHKHKMHMPLMAVEAMLMKRVIISTLSGGMSCLFNERNCIPVNKGEGFLVTYESYNEEELLKLVEQGYRDVKIYINTTIRKMEEIFSS